MLELVPSKKAAQALRKCKHCGADKGEGMENEDPNAKCGQGDCKDVTVGNSLVQKTGFGQPLLANTSTLVTGSSTDSTASALEPAVVTPSAQPSISWGAVIPPASASTSAFVAADAPVEASAVTSVIVATPEKESEEEMVETTSAVVEATVEVTQTVVEPPATAPAPTPTPTAPRPSITWGAAVSTTPTTASSTPFFSFGLPPRSVNTTPVVPPPPIPLRKPSGPQLYDAAMFKPKPKPVEEPTPATAPEPMTASSLMDVFDASSSGFMADSPEFNLEDLPELSIDPEMRTPSKPSRTHVGKRTIGPLDGVIMHASKRKARKQEAIAERVKGQQIAESLARRVRQKRTVLEAREDAPDLSDALLIDLVTEDDYPGVRTRARVSDVIAGPTTSNPTGRTRTATVGASPMPRPSHFCRSSIAPTTRKPPVVRQPVNKPVAKSAVSTPQPARSSRSMSPPSAQVSARPATQPRAAAVSTPQPAKDSPTTRATVKTAPSTSRGARGPAVVLTKAKPSVETQPVPASETRIMRRRASAVGLGTPVQATASVVPLSSVPRPRRSSASVAPQSWLVSASPLTRRPVVELDTTHMQRPSTPLIQTRPNASTAQIAASQQAAAGSTSRTFTQTSNRVTATPQPAPQLTPAATRPVARMPMPRPGSQPSSASSPFTTTALPTRPPVATVASSKSGSQAVPPTFSAPVNPQVQSQSTPAAAQPVASSSRPSNSTANPPHPARAPQADVTLLPAAPGYQNQVLMDILKTMSQRSLTRDELSQWQEPGRASIWLKQNYRLSHNHDYPIRQIEFWRHYQSFFSLPSNGPPIPPLIRGSTLISLLPRVFPSCHIGGNENDFGVTGLVRRSGPADLVFDGPRLLAPVSPRLPPLPPALQKIKPKGTPPASASKTASSSSKKTPGSSTPSKGTKRKGGDDWDVLREGKRKVGRPPKPKVPDGSPASGAKMAYQPLVMRPRLEAPSSAMRDEPQVRLPPLPSGIPAPQAVASDVDAEGETDVETHEPPQTLMDENLLQGLKDYLGTEQR